MHLSGAIFLAFFVSIKFYWNLYGIFWVMHLSGAIFLAFFAIFILVGLICVGNVEITDFSIPTFLFGQFTFLVIHLHLRDNGFHLSWFVFHLCHHLLHFLLVNLTTLRDPQARFLF